MLLIIQDFFLISFREQNLATAAFDNFCEGLCFFELTVVQYHNYFQDCIDAHMYAEVTFKYHLLDDTKIIAPELPKEIGNKTHFHYVGLLIYCNMITYQVSINFYRWVMYLCGKHRE